MLLKKILCVVSAAAVISANLLNGSSVLTCADGPAASPASAKAAAEMPEGIDAKCVYVCETGTGKALFERNSEEKLPMGHFAKLMTALLAAEALESGKLSLDDTVTVSSNANSKQGTQIWLDAGEKISVEELIKSITIGNANDANTALGEKLAGSEEKFIKIMNSRAKKLGMKNTHFEDCCGTDKKTVSTAKDIAILSSELAKHNDLTTYFTTWMGSVRNQSVELVSTNRLVRTCKGLRGGKSCSLDEVGESLSAWVNRDDFSVCTVLIGCKSPDDKFSQSSDLLDESFRNFSVFSPDIDKEYLADINLSGGEKLKLSVKQNAFNAIVIPAGVRQSIIYEAKIKQSINAPVKKGDKVGKIVYTLDGEKLLEVEIVAAETVEKMTFGYAFKKNLLNLFNLHSM